MTIDEFYLEVGGEYSAVLGRLMTDQRILKFIAKFPGAKDYSEFKEALAAEDYPTAFRAVHSLKGVCLNLEFGNLARSSSVVCELMRPGVKPEIDISGLVADIDRDYRATLEAIGKLL